jgi:GT2 family glycosyltransferase
MNLPFHHPLWIESHAIDPRISRIAGSSFVSMLISRAAIERYGLPVKEFFIWFDDVEYSRRISTTLPGYLVTDSIAIHKTPENIDALDFNLLDEKSLWKFKYGVRNQCSYHFENGGVIEGMLFVGKVLARLSRTRRNWRLRAAILGACFRGYRFRYRRYIEHVQSRPS